MQIARPTQADLTWIVALEARLFSKPWGRAHFQQALLQQDPFWACWMAKEDPQGVGYMVAQGGGDFLHVGTLGVDPAYQRKGIGRAMLRHFMQSAKAAGVVQMALEVRESNVSASALYGSEGWERVGRRKHFYSDPMEDAIILTYQVIDGAGAEGERK